MHLSVPKAREVGGGCRNRTTLALRSAFKTNALASCSPQRMNDLHRRIKSNLRQLFPAVRYSITTMFAGTFAGTSAWACRQKMRRLDRTIGLERGSSSLCGNTNLTDTTES